MKNSYLLNLMEANLLYHVFQPIYDLDNNEIIGYEALLRSKLNDMPYDLFQMAIKENNLYQLDTHSFSNAVKYFSAVGYFDKPYVLFLNIFPSTLLNPHFEKMIESLMKQVSLFIPSNQIVLEINESEDFGNLDKAKEIIERIRKKGFRIAIDDVGNRGASIHRIVELEVELFKLDQYFAKGLSKSTDKQKLLAILLLFVKEKKQVILEGIENEHDLASAKNIGIRWGQGYYLGKPKELFNNYNSG